MKTNKILSVILLVLVNANASVVSILGRDYWKSTLLVENNLPVPNWIQHTASETLLFMNRQTLKFANLDYTIYKILPESKERTFETILDKNGNSIMNVDGYLVYSTKDSESMKMVESKDHKVFKDLSLDRIRSMAYMIGVDHADSSGRLFVFDTTQPTTTEHQVLVEEVSQLGSRLKSLSVDQITGNVVFIEVFEDASWKIILLSANDFKLMTGIPIDSEEFNKTLVNIFNIPQSQLQKDFNAAVEKMMDTIISSSVETCSVRASKLQLENQRLRHQISIISSAHQYVLEKSYLKYVSSDDAFLTESSDIVDKKIQSKFKSFVKNAGRNITNMLNQQNVRWIDDTDGCSLGAVGNQKCGLMRSDNPLALFPWTVSILKPPFPYTFICYGTLVHPKVVIPSLSCPLPSGEFIARSGIMNSSSASIDIPQHDRRILKSLSVELGTILLVEEFSATPGRSPVCFPKKHVQLSSGSNCRGLKDDKINDSVESLPVAILEKCPKNLGDFRFSCINTHCTTKFHYDAIYCPLNDTKILHFYGGYVRTYDCYDIFVNIGIYGSHIIEKLAKENINMTAFL